jgi:alpha-galactosidase
MEGFFNDLEIPIKYGIRQPTSMTVGPSGISAALRTAPVAYEIVEDMEEVCPGALLLNVTNPMSVVTRAMNMAARSVSVIGLCHEFHDFSEYVGPILGLGKPADMHVLDYLYTWLPAQGLDYTVAGVNHFIWLTEASLRGEDVIPRIREFAMDNEELATEVVSGTAPWQNLSAAKLAVCRTFGRMPVVGDRHLIEFLPGLCNTRNGYGMKYGVHKTTVDLRRHRISQALDDVRRITESGDDMDWTASGEEAPGIMRALVTGGTQPVVANLPNKGQISNLPDDVVVETLAEVGPAGVVAKPSGALPGAVGALCQLHAEVHELTVRAALEGDRGLLIEALSLDPLSGNADFAELGALGDELLAANRKWLPRFYS